MSDESSALGAGEIRERLAEGNLGAAEDLLKKAQDDNPDCATLMLLAGQLLELKGDRKAARQHYKHVREKFPDNAMADYRLAVQSLARNKLDKAEEYLGSAAQKGLDEEKLLRLRKALLGKLKDENAIKALISDDSVMLSVSVDEKILAARAHQKIGNYKEAAKLAKEVLDQQPDNINALDVIAVTAKKMGHAQKSLATYTRLSELDPDNILWMIKKIRLLINIGKPDEAVELFGRAVAMAKSQGRLGETNLLHIAKILRLPPEMAKPLVEWADNILKTDGGVKIQEKRLARSILHTYSQDALEEVEKRYARSFHEEKKILDWSTLIPRAGDLKRPVLTDDSSGEIVISPTGPSPTAVLVFTGLADRVMLPLKMFDHYLASLGVTAVYLRDTHRLLFTKGLRSLANNLDDTLVELRRILSERGIRDVVAIGSSAGGYGAIKFGLELQARSIVSFSGPTLLTDEAQRKDRRVRIIAKRVLALPEDLRDPRPLIRKMNGRIPIHIVYGEDMPEDRQHAMYLKDEPGVILHPLGGEARHATLIALALDHKLLPFLEETVLESVPC